MIFHAKKIITFFVSFCELFCFTLAANPFFDFSIRYWSNKRKDLFFYFFDTSSAPGRYELIYRRPSVFFIYAKYFENFDARFKVAFNRKSINFIYFLFGIFLFYVYNLYLVQKALAVVECCQFNKCWLYHRWVCSQYCDFQSPKSFLCVSYSLLCILLSIIYYYQILQTSLPSKFKVIPQYQEAYS